MVSNFICQKIQSRIIVMTADALSPLQSGQAMSVPFWDVENGPVFWMQNTRGEDKEIGHDRQPTEIFEVEIQCWGKDTKPIMDMFQRALHADLKRRKTAKGLSVYTNASQWGQPKWRRS